MQINVKFISETRVFNKDQSYQNLQVFKINKNLNIDNAPEAQRMWKRGRRGERSKTGRGVCTPTHISKGERACTRTSIKV